MEHTKESFLEDHLKERCLDTSIHTVWYGEGVVSFPIYQLDGALVGYQQYRPFAPKAVPNNPRLGRYYTRIRPDKYSVWGLESWKFSNTLFICEGIFDAAKITASGYSAIAILSFDTTQATKAWLKTVRTMRDTVAVCDNDQSGKRLAKYATRHITVEKYHDLGDMPVSLVASLCSKLNKN